MQVQEIQGGMQGHAGEIGASTTPEKVKAKWDPKGRRNLIIIGGVTGFAAILLIILSMGGGDAKEREPGKESAATQNQDLRTVPNGMISQDDRQQLALQEDARIAEAQRAGTSMVANPVAPSSVIIAPGTLPPADQHGVPSGGPIATTRMDTTGPAAPASAANADAQMDAEKLRGMSDQMSRMMAAWGMSGEAPARASTYVREHSAQKAQAQVAGASDSADAVRSPDDRMVIPAHEEAYAAETMGPIDTDTPGKLRARILSGPLSGAVVTGVARRIGTTGVQFDFTGGSFRGVPIKIAAYGVDMDTSGDVVEGDYHGRYMQRFVFPVLAEGIKAYAGARAQVGTQVIAITVPGVPGGTTGAQQTPAPDAEQARSAMVSAGAGQAAQVLKAGPQQGHITLDVRTQFGVVFEEPVFQSDLAGTGRKTTK